MKVLFLDIDGVVNSEETMKQAAKNKTMLGIDNYMAFLVARVVQNTDCKVVLSSSWRHHPDSVKEVEDRFGKLYGVTPTLSGCRGDEIKNWLDNHPEVSKYAILDDDIDMLEEQMPNFFKTSWKTGITEEIAKKVEEHLS